VFDKRTWDSIGPWNLRYMFQGGAADWLERARIKGFLVQPQDWQTDFLHPDYGWGEDCPQHSKDFVHIDWHDSVPCSTMHQIVQNDLDMFYLQMIYSNGDSGKISAETQFSIDFYASLFGPSLSEDLLDRTWKESIRAAAIIIVYDDSRFLPQVLEDIIPRVEHVIILLGTKPWNGPPRNNSETYSQVIDMLGEYKGNEVQNKVSLITGSWDSEADQRNFGSRVAAFLPGNLTHGLVVDTDELYHPVDLERMLIVASQNPVVPYFMAEMTTYWKSIHMMIDPPESLLVLWLVDFYRCWFHNARAAQCNVETEEEGQGAIFSRNMGVCHHLSYTRTDEELFNKVTSYSHASEVASDWLERVWYQWDAKPGMENIHPTEPTAYKRAIKAPLHSMHPSLRKIYLEEIRDCVNISETDWSARQKIFCLRVQDEKKTSKSRELCPVFEFQNYQRAGQQIDLDAKKRKKSLQWESAEGDSFVNRLEPNQILEQGFIDLDPDDGKDSCPPRFMVLVICEGEIDYSTQGVFEDIALVIASGLKRLGYDVITKTCFDFRFCMATGNRVIILLGVHHLGRYIHEDIGSETAYLFLTGWPDPKRTILYNFEHVASQQDFSSQHTKEILEYFGPNVWDYSLSNVKNLQKKGITVKYVPLGYVPELSIDSSYEEDIDVLFYGRLNAHRKSILETLRANGIQVLHANAREPIFGKQLNQLIMRSKIILNLRYFLEEEEWKMTRFLRPLANAKLIVSERSGNDEELLEWKEGVIFVETTLEMIEVIQRYLKTDISGDQSKIAKIGRQIFSLKKQENLLSQALSPILSSFDCSHKKDETDSII